MCEFEPVEFMYYKLLIVRYGNLAGMCSVQLAARLLQCPEAMILYDGLP